jgi:hypothetical protein
MGVSSTSTDVQEQRATMRATVGLDLIRIPKEQPKATRLFRSIPADLLTRSPDWAHTRPAWPKGERWPKGPFGAPASSPCSSER